MTEVRIPEGALAVARAVAEAMPENAWHSECWHPKVVLSKVDHKGVYRFSDAEICPMGFLPEALEAAPEKPCELSGAFTEAEVECFYRWWDHLDSEPLIESALRAIAKLRRSA